MHLLLIWMIILGLASGGRFPRQTFRRDAVEKIADYPFQKNIRTGFGRFDTNAPKSSLKEYLFGEYGTRNLPLREAVESLPLPIFTAEERSAPKTMRLPLRDAVEKRPEVSDFGDNVFRTPGGGYRYTINYEPYQFDPMYYQLIPNVQTHSTYDYGWVQSDDDSVELMITPENRNFFGRTARQSRKVQGKRTKNRNKNKYGLRNDLLGSPPEYKTVCYVEGWASYRQNPVKFSNQKIDPNLCTHVVYAFAAIDPHSYHIYPQDEEHDLVQGGYRSVVGLKRDNPNLKVLISIGGWADDDQKFTQMTSSASRRQKFIRSVAKFLDKYNFDGIDIDWQYPGAEDMGGTKRDKDQLVMLLEELSEVFRVRDWTLSISVPPSRFRIEDGYNVPEIASYVDLINLLAFDYHADREMVADHPSPLYRREHDHGLDVFYNVDYSVQYWLKRGAPRSKLVLGLPIFGRSFTLSHKKNTDIGSEAAGLGTEGRYTQSKGFLAYFEVCDRLRNGWTRKVDSVGSPYMIKDDQWVGYEDQYSIRQKVEYIKTNNLAGAGLYAIDLDDFNGICGEKWPLSRTVQRYLKNKTVPKPISDTESNTTEILPPVQGTVIVRPDDTNCTGQGFARDPNDCRLYYRCTWNSKTTYVCPGNLHFDETLGLCNWPELAQCKQSHLESNLIFRDAHEGDYKIVCYFTNWSGYRKGEGKFVPENLDPRLCTHIIYAYASLDPNDLNIKPFDPIADIDNDLYGRAVSMKGPKTKVILGVGGWTDSTGDKYSKLVSNNQSRRKFIATTIEFLQKYKFDGLHIDWNYPKCWQSNCNLGPDSDRNNFVLLIKELRESFDKQNLILASGISGYREVIDVAYDVRELSKNLDFMSVMTYDYHGAWEKRTGHVSPLYYRNGDTFPRFNTNYTLEYLVSLGAERGKLVMGIPFYGQSFTLADEKDNSYGAKSVSGGVPGPFTKQPGMLAYYEICDFVKNRRWVVSQDREGATGPYAFSADQWVSYDDLESVKQKARLVRNVGYGGVMAWTVDLDDFNNKCCRGTFPLLKTIGRVLGHVSNEESDREDCTKPQPPITPPPPITTTGVDSGDNQYTTEQWQSSTNTPPTSTTWPTWEQSTKSTTTTQKTSTWPTWEQSTKSTTTTQKTSTWPTWEQSTKSTTTTQKTSTWPTWTTSTTATSPVSTTTPWWASSEPSWTNPPPSSTTESQTTSTTTETGDGDNSITGTCDPGAYYPNPKNCNAYYRCLLGEYQIQYCIGGLHWNKQLNICDWPDSAMCDKSSIVVTTTKKSTNFISTTTRRPTTATAPTTTTLRYPTTTQPPNDEICTNGQYYEAPGDCDAFIICVNGRRIKQGCAAGLKWNQNQKICDWAHNVQCKSLSSFSIKGDGLQNRPCQSGSYANYPGDCNKYMSCLWGVYQIYNCAPGLHWNNQEKICDWPNRSHCKELVIPGTGGISDQLIPTIKPPIKPTEETSTVIPVRPPSTVQSGYFKIVCYFTNWAWYRQGDGKYLPEDIDANLCTHIIYGFAVLDYENLIIKAHDSWADFDNKFYSRVVAYKAKGIKVSLAIGGWNDSQGDKYSRLVNNPQARARFIKNVIEFLKKYDFDGLDLDWEYPKCWQVDCNKGPDSDKSAFSAWVRELHNAFAPHGLLLSSAVSPSKTVIDAGYDVPTLAKYLDWIAVMTYDYHGQWDKKTGHVAPMYYHPDDEFDFFNANFSINYWISEGAPRRKIVMGMPLYGQSFSLTNEKDTGLNSKAPGPGQAGDFTRAAGFLAYYEICERINKGWHVVKDSKNRMGPYAYYGNQWVSFDDVDTIRQKSEFIRKMDLGGGMIWALDLDDFRGKCGGGKHPLLSTIRNILGPAPNEIDLTTSKPTLPDENEIIPTQSSTTGVSPTESTIKTTTGLDLTSTPTVSTPISNNDNGKFKVVCYFTNWAWYRQGIGKYVPSDIDPNLCTHILYGFAVLNGDEGVIKPHDTWADFDNKFYEKVTEFKKRGIKVLVAIGGWNDSAGDKYSRLVNNPSARAKFITHVIQFIKKHNFDGLDLDWEYPKCWQVNCQMGPESDKQAFADWVRELHNAFKPEGLLLSAAVSPSRYVIDAGYDVPALSKYLDWISVMTYDYHGQWDKITGHVAPMYSHPDDTDVTFNANYSIHYWISKGADKEKIIMGMPMYGQSFSLADNNNHGLNAPTYGGGEAGDQTRARGFMSYYEICHNIRTKGWTVVRDKKNRMGPYAYQRDQWVSFDDQQTIKRKSEFIRNLGLGGGMIWALDLDDFRDRCDCGETYPLLKTINRVLRNYPGPGPICKLDGIESENTIKSTLQPIRTTKMPPIRSEVPCNGRIFADHSSDCNKYYQCQHGQFNLMSCPAGLFWNKDHCDWPENTKCNSEQENEVGIVDTTIRVPVTIPVTTIVPSTTSEIIPSKPSNSEYKVVCYFTNWAWYRQGVGKYTPDNIDVELCTHVAYGFAVLDSNTLTIKPHDSWADIDNNFYNKVTALKKRGVKVLIAIGGWNDSLGDKYSRLVKDPSSRLRFIENVIEFIRKYDFDGLDLDWEYPKCWQVNCQMGPDEDKSNFAEFVRELSEAFKPRGLLLSSAVSPSKVVIDMGYEVAKLSEYFDYISVMTYDFHGHWDKATGHVAPLYYYPGDTYDYFNANFSLNYWIENGAVAKKIIMGMPLYGQSFQLMDSAKHDLYAPAYGPGEAGEFTRAAGFLAFYEICEKVKRQGWTVVRDDKGRMGPYAYKDNQWVSYDDVSDIRRKAQLVKSMGLGGGMIWALDLDDFRNRCGCGVHPLLKTLNEELRGISRTKFSDCT